MKPNVLLVDDDAALLKAYEVRLGRLFSLFTAAGPERALEVLRDESPWSVVVSDMRMPRMDGVQLLQQVQRFYPDAVRIMITGNADLTTAIRAVNEGQIFRFLTKPCSHEDLARAIDAGIRQHELQVAERELLEQTLRGAIRVLTDVMSLVNPTAFSRADRARRYVRHMVTRLELSGAWQYELAAMLSQIGSVSLLPMTLDKAYAGAELTREEQEAFAFHPTVAADLLSHIPRLDRIAEMIRRQLTPADQLAVGADLAEADPAEAGAAVLRAALEFDALTSRGLPPAEAIEQMARRRGELHPQAVAALEGADVQPEGLHVRFLDIDDLDAHMVTGQDITARDGRLLVASGQSVTYPMILNLQRWARRVGIDQPIRMFAPAGHRSAGSD